MFESAPQYCDCELEAGAALSPPSCQVWRKGLRQVAHSAMMDQCIAAWARMLTVTTVLTVWREGLGWSSVRRVRMMGIRLRSSGKFLLDADCVLGELVKSLHKTGSEDQKELDASVELSVEVSDHGEGKQPEDHFDYEPQDLNYQPPGVLHAWVSFMR